MGNNSQKTALSQSRVYTLKLLESFPSSAVKGMFIFN